MKRGLLILATAGMLVMPVPRIAFGDNEERPYNAGCIGLEQAETTNLSPVIFELGLDRGGCASNLPPGPPTTGPGAAH
jgi:hypothetical protein